MRKYLSLFIDITKKILKRNIVYPRHGGFQALIALIFFFLIFIFLAYYTPFDLDKLESDRFIPSLVYAFITAASVFIVLLIAPLVSPSLKEHGGFNNMHLFVLFLLTSVLTISGVRLYTLNSPYSDIINVNLKYAVLLLDLVFSPALVAANFINWETKKIIIIDLPFFEKEMQKKTDQETPEKMVIRNSDSKKILETNASDFIYALSNQNYTFIYILNNGQAERLLLRIPFGQLYVQLEHLPGVIRCHRTRIVNLRFATNLVMNEGKRLLKLKYIDEAIPVARRYNIEDHFPSLAKPLKNRLNS